MALAVESFGGYGPGGSKNVFSHPENFYASDSTSIVQDSGDDAISNLAKDLNIKLDDSTKDYLTQYYFNEKSNETAWNRQMQASNTQYQRAVEDLRKAGLNPFLVFDSLKGSSPTSNGQSVQGGLYTSRKNEKESNAVSAVSKVLSVLGVIAAAVIYAL